MASCPNQKQRLAECTCSYEPCSRKGICCECVAYHRDRGEIPGCFFSPEAEKSYDRSVTAFIRSKKKF